VRGFTRDIEGKKHYIDHEINSIQKFMSEDTRMDYQMMDVNIFQENTFHTKMIKKELELDDYLFGEGTKGLIQQERDDIEARLRNEMLEIYYSRNMNK